MLLIKGFYMAGSGTPLRTYTILSGKISPIQRIRGIAEKAAGSLPSVENMKKPTKTPTKPYTEYEHEVLERIKGRTLSENGLKELLATFKGILNLKEEIARLEAENNVGRIALGLQDAYKNPNDISLPGANINILG